MWTLFYEPVKHYGPALRHITTGHIQGARGSIARRWDGCIGSEKYKAHHADRSMRQRLDRWVRRDDGYYIYHANAEELAMGDQYDRKYLDDLRQKDPDKFLAELTPNPEHNGQCVGLDLSHPPHRKLQQDYQVKIVAVCREKGLREHPALLIKQLPWVRTWARVIMSARDISSDFDQDSYTVQRYFSRFFQEFPGLKKWIGSMVLCYANPLASEALVPTSAYAVPGTDVTHHRIEASAAKCILYAIH